MLFAIFLDLAPPKTMFWPPPKLSPGSANGYLDLRQKYPNIHTNFLAYQRLKCAIPSLWLDILRNGNYRPLTDAEREEPYEIKLSENWLSAKNIKSKQFYLDQIPIQTPTAQLRWEGEGCNLNWKRVYETPYQCTRSTKLQSLQYRILHRYIPTKRYLFIRGISDSEKCPTCIHTETLRHFLFHCHDVKCIWEHVKIKLSTSNNDLPIPLYANNIIFGLVSGRKAHNLIILLAKQYIVNCKLGSTYSAPNVEAFKKVVDQHILTEKTTAIRSNKLENFLEKWRGFVTSHL